MRDTADADDDSPFSIDFQRLADFDRLFSFPGSYSGECAIGRVDVHNHAPLPAKVEHGALQHLQRGADKCGVIDAIKLADLEFTGRCDDRNQGGI